MSDTISPEQAAALEVARSLAAAGIPIFVAPPKPDPSEAMPFALPDGWQHTPPDPSAVDRWRPGMALCAVMGHGLDLLDLDPRNGADLDALGAVPVSYGAAATPSEGLHSFVASLGVGSRDKVAPGIDVKAGTAGEGHGFAFLAPTVKPSKVDGTPRAYQWITPPDLGRLAAARAAGGDNSGAELAGLIRALRANGSSVKRTSSAPDWFRPFLESKEPQSVPAATRAISEKLTAVIDWEPSSPAGFRQTLMRAAMTLGGYVGGGWLDEGHAWAQLEQATASVWGAADEDDRKWILQGLSDGAESPFHVYTPEDEARFGEAAQAVAATRVGASWSPQRALGSHPFDPAGAVHDQEYAEASLARGAGTYRYGADVGLWLRRRMFDRWSEMPNQADSLVADVARLMPLGQTPVPRDTAERSEEHWQAVRRALFLSSAGSGRISRKINALVAGGDHPCTVDVAALDSEPEVLWAGGAPYDLRASLEVPTPAALHPDTPHLHTASCTPAPVDTPAWDAFVAAVLPDPELRAWALRVLGVTLTGYADAVVPVLYGRERSGKTSLITLVMRALGTYGHAADPRLLSGDLGAHASIVHALKGRRLSFIDEGPRRGHLAAERLKQLTGGGQLTGNAMRSNPITFDPTHTLVMTTNDEPPITDPALRARVRLIPCDQPEGAVRAARQAITPAVWEAEAPGILAALMREAAAWLEEPDTAGIKAAPAFVREMLGDMAAGQDPVTEWAEMCTVPTHPGTPARDLFRRFLLWHEGQPAYRRMAPPTETAFGRRLSELGYPPHIFGPDRKRYRSLSVMNPGGEPPPWAPTDPSGAAVVPTAPGAGSERVESGFGPQPSQTDNNRSDPLSSSSREGREGVYRPITTENTDTPNRANAVSSQGENRGEALTLSDAGNHSAPDLGQPGLERVSPNPLTPAAPKSAQPARESTPTSRATSLSVAPEVAEVAARLEARTPDDDPEVEKRAAAALVNRELARLAETVDRPKTELRKELTAARKELKRVAAVTAAGGAVHALPAVVDRRGLVVPIDADTAAQVVRARLAATGGTLTVDVEHTGYPIGHELYRLKTVQLGDDAAVVVLDPVAHHGLILALLAEAPVWHAHSATADLVPLAVAGLLPDGYDAAWDRMYDTVIPAKLADPASTGSDPGLKRLSATVLGDHAVTPAADAARSALFAAGKWKTDVGVGDPLERSGWAQVDVGCETMIRYAGSDVLDTHALARTLPPPEGRVAARERLAQRMTNRGAYRGVRLDGDHVAALDAQHRPAMADAARRACAFGIDNPGSDAQVGARATTLGAQLPLTKTGKPSVAKGVLNPLREAPGPLGEFVSAVLDYRHHDTVIGLFLEPYADLCHRGDGRARPTVYTLGTNTGRMSCVRPNLQQLSKKGGVRACITADPGQAGISADFSGVEIRVAAALSQDPTLLRMLAEGRDLHEEIALQVWGPDAEASAKAGRPAPLKANRYRAKGMVFGRIYGGGLATLSAQVGVSQATGQQVLDTLDALTPQLKTFSRSVSDAARGGRTRFPSYSGRTIHLPQDTPHKALNYCVQGSARELLVDALERWADTRWGDCTLIPVHDELIAFVPAGEAEAATAELQRCMTSELYGVPITSEADQPWSSWPDST